METFDEDLSYTKFHLHYLINVITVDICNGTALWSKTSLDRGCRSINTVCPSAFRWLHRKRKLCGQHTVKITIFNLKPYTTQFYSYWSDSPKCSMYSTQRLTWIYTSIHWQRKIRPELAFSRNFYFHFYFIFSCKVLLSFSEQQKFRRALQQHLPEHDCYHL